MDKIVVDILVFLALLSGGFFIFWFAYKRKTWASLISILALGLILRVYLSSDPYLHHWDERYHSLVAKNLADHPLTPTLFDDPVLETDESNWIGSHVWLSKPPIPLWLMAGSISAFGSNEFAVRLPSVVLSIIAIFVTFLLAKKLFNERVGLLAAFLHAINGLIIESAAGRVSSDHVETLFIIFVELAIYCVVLSLDGKRVKRLLFIAGLFTGFSFLSKWFPAFIVFPVWLFAYVQSGEFNWKNLISNGLILIGATALIAVPWLMHIKSFEGDILGDVLFAFSQPIQNHEEPFLFYWHQIMIIFGELVYIPLIFLFYTLYKKQHVRQAIVLLVWIMIPLIVFTLGSTKRHTYILIAAPAFFIGISYCFFHIYEVYKRANRKWIVGLVLIGLVVLPIRYNIERMKFFQNEPEPTLFYANKDKWMDQFNSSDVVFGLPENIELMFFTNVKAAYKFIPDVEVRRNLAQEGSTIYIYQEGEFLEESAYYALYKE